MTEPRPLAITSYFAAVDDPRLERTKAHALLDMIVIAICAVICGADGWVAATLGAIDGCGVGGSRANPERGDDHRATV